MNDEDQQERMNSIAPDAGSVDTASFEYSATTPEPAVPPAVDRHPATGAMSAERLAMKALEARLLGGERKLRRREVAAGAGLSLLSARKLWRALGFPNFGDEDVAFTERDQAALSTVVDLVRSGKLTEEAAISVTRAIGQ
ncbi:MAG: adenylate/guanylate cyclase domain-containing protein, partial [Pseudarthrobacter sp.]|nr:adenylate/guanylate cyclase domain-containing protein [Pseudarthrobacter sp.]